MEALLRWKRSNGETVSPAKFVPILEDLRLIAELGAWIVRESVNQFMEWQESYSRFEQMTLNLNCHYGQGFLFSQALPAPDPESLLLEWKYGKISRK